MSGVLHGIRVVEIADELAAHAGLELAGLGADVIKVEPPEGSATRRLGPFDGDDPGPGVRRSSSGSTTGASARS